MTLHSSKQEFRVYDKPEPEVGQEMGATVWQGLEDSTSLCNALKIVVAIYNTT